MCRSRSGSCAGFFHTCLPSSLGGTTTTERLSTYSGTLWATVLSLVQAWRDGAVLQARLASFTLCFPTSSSDTAATKRLSTYCRHSVGEDDRLATSVACWSRSGACAGFFRHAHSVVSRWLCKGARHSVGEGARSDAAATYWSRSRSCTRFFHHLSSVVFGRPCCNQAPFDLVRYSVGEYARFAAPVVCGTVATAVPVSFTERFVSAFCSRMCSVCRKRAVLEP